MLVCKYKFDSSIYADLIPEFNDGYNGYVVTDEVSGNIVIRTIECDTLPTLMRFGVAWIDSDTDVANSDRCGSLLEILDMNTSEIITMSSMFRRCKNLTSIKCNWNTSKVANIYSIFEGCYKLISVDISNLCTNQTIINMFRECSSLTELDLSKWDTSKVTNVGGFVRGCTNLTELDLSNWNTSQITAMDYMFCNCNKLTLLDISNFDMSKVTNTTSMFANTPLLKDIGMVNCDINTINKVGALTTATLWVGEHINIADYNGTAPIKTYREDIVEVKLNSPLLKGDSIEVIDGKLCHVHKSNSVVLDGGENWMEKTDGSYRFDITPQMPPRLYPPTTGSEICNNIKFSRGLSKNEKKYGFIFYGHTIYRTEVIWVTEMNFDDAIEWLSKNPSTVVYQLHTPIIENITPLQSEIVLKTFEECNMNIVTNLPIKTNVSYRTNVPSITVLTAQVDEIEKSGTVVANLTDVIEQEIDK